MINILTAPVIRVRTANAINTNSIPEVFATLALDQVEAFPALRPHQKHPWHAFLVQLAAMALLKAGIKAPPKCTSEWQTLIQNLTPDFPDDEPWQLVVDDITKPAFMQPPAGDWKDFNERAPITTPDGLDMLDTAKNHDQKASVAWNAQLDDWLMALVSAQTMSGYVGKGNYPIARMNSGDGSRTAFSVTSSTRHGAHFRRDLQALLEMTHTNPEIPYRRDGLALLWTEHWDRNNGTPFNLCQLHPLHIEVCRRRRLRARPDGRLEALKAGSPSRRIDAAARRGDVGDPWTLVDLRDQKGPKALSLPEGGFTYRRIVDYLISEEWRRPPLSLPGAQEAKTPALFLAMRGIRRKQGGQTEGYHERIVPIRERAKEALAGNEQLMQELGDVAHKMVEQAALLQLILSHAIQTFSAQGDTGGIRPEHGRTAQPWLNRLDQIIDDGFFNALQDELEADDELERNELRGRWLYDGQGGIIDHARRILREATESLPCPAVKRYLARAAAQRLFEGRVHGNDGFMNALLATRGNETSSTTLDAETRTTASQYIDDRQRRDDRDIAFRMVVSVAALSIYHRGEFAQLRRMDPDNPDNPTFRRIMARENLLGHRQCEIKWALALHGMALMTRAAGDVNVRARTPHDGNVSVGRALFEAGYSETRLGRLLAARDGMLRGLLTRAFRTLGSTGKTFNWQEMAAFIICQGTNEEAAERGRRRIARSYYRAQEHGQQAELEETE